MDLKDLPNIGPVLEKDLRTAGIDTPEALRAAGAEEAWLRIRLAGCDACLHKLEALAGAEAGILKRELPPERKAELKAFFKSHK